MINLRSDNEDLPKRNEARISEALEWLNRLEVAQLELEQSTEKKFRQIMNMFDEIFPTGKHRVYQEEERSEVKGSDLQLEHPQHTVVSVSAETSNRGTNPSQVKPQHHTIVADSGETSEREENPPQVQPEIMEADNQVIGDVKEISQMNGDELLEAASMAIEEGKPTKSTILRESCRRFMDLTAPFGRLTEEKTCLRWFTVGLKREIRVGLWLHDPGGFTVEFKIQICSSSYGSGHRGNKMTYQVRFIQNPNALSIPNPNSLLILNANSSSPKTLISLPHWHLTLIQASANPNFSSTKTLVAPLPTPNPSHDLTNPNSLSSKTLNTHAPLLILRHYHANPNSFFTKTLSSQPPSPSLLCELVNRNTSGFCQLRDGKLQQMRSNDLYLWCIDDVRPGHKCLLYTATCSGLCNDSVIQHNQDQRNYARIGKTTEVVPCVLVEKIAIPIFEFMTAALKLLTELAYKGRETSFPKLELAGNNSELEAHTAEMSLRSVGGFTTTKPMKMEEKSVAANSKTQEDTGELESELNSVEVSSHYNYKFPENSRGRIAVRVGSGVLDFEVGGGRKITKFSIVLSAIVTWGVAGIRMVGWGCTTVNCLYKIVTCILLDLIEFAIRYALRGRAERVQSWECYHLYPRCFYEAFVDYQLPELLQTPIQPLHLQIKIIQFGSNSMFMSKPLQPTEPLSIQSAPEYLKINGALDENENLAELRSHLSMLPLKTKLGKMLTIGAISHCLQPVMTIITSLSVRDQFMMPFNKKELAELAWAQFLACEFSDHLVLVRAYDGWKDAERKQASYEYISIISGLVDNVESRISWSHDHHLCRADICTWLLPGICYVVIKEKYVMLNTMEDGDALLYSNSVNSQGAKIPYSWLVFNEKVKVNSIFLRYSTVVSDFVVLLK